MICYVISNNIIKHIYHYYICVGCTVPMDLCLGGYVCVDLCVWIYVWIYVWMCVWICVGTCMNTPYLVIFSGPNTYIPFMSVDFKQLYMLYAYSNYQYKVAHINTVNRNTFDTIYMINYDITT